MIINVHEYIKESFVDRLVSLFPKVKLEYFVESIEIQGSDKLTDMIEKFCPVIADIELFKNLSYTNLLGRRARHETFFNNLSVKLLFYVDEAQVKFHVTEDQHKLYIIDNKVLKLEIELMNGIIKNKNHEHIHCSQEDLLDLFSLSFYGNHINEWYKTNQCRKPAVFEQIDVDYLLANKGDVINFILVKEMVMA